MSTVQPILAPTLLACAGLLAAPVVSATTVASASSPDGRITVELDLSAEGRIGYRVQRDGKPLIADSRLGMRLGNGAELLRHFALQGQQTRRVDDTWEQPWGEVRHIRNHYNELRAQLVETVRDKRRIDIVFRIYDDGLGFRYEVPKQPHLNQVLIQGETTEITLAEPAGTSAWWTPAGDWNRYEQLYRTTAADAVGLAHTPITLRTADGTHLALHEAALVDYSGMWLQRIDGGTFRVQLAPNAAGAVVKTTPFTTPWRTIQISDRAGGLVESHLILNLNEPNALGDVSWVKPYKYVGVWWGMHLGSETWGRGPQHGATTANVRRYIDFAAEHGFRGVLVEGWNPGWDGDWFANGWGFDFTRPTADFDLRALAAYARDKGVRLIGHHETACAIDHYEAQLGQALDMNQRLGIDSIKTGYVCDAGQVERRRPDGTTVREWHDGQFMSNHHLRVVTEAAKRKIAVNAHEPIKDTGLRRTYPNWVAREGARGMEYNAWGEPPNPPEHEANLIFTRMLAGPMDFTPGVLSLEGKGQPIQSTLAKQLALYVVLYSPIQMAADLPEHYAKQMEAFQFIKDVPVDWEFTRMLNGEVGDHATIVRKDRNGPDWYLGSITDEHPRTLRIKLDFLTPGKTYLAQIYRDGEDADYRGDKRFSFRREQRRVSADDTLELKLAPGGGQAIRFQAL